MLVGTVLCADLFQFMFSTKSSVLGEGGVVTVALEEGWYRGRQCRTVLVSSAVGA